MLPAAGDSANLSNSSRRSSNTSNSSSAGSLPTGFCVQYSATIAGVEYTTGGCLSELVGQENLTDIQCNYTGQRQIVMAPFMGGPTPGVEGEPILAEPIPLTVFCCNSTLCNKCRKLKPRPTSSQQAASARWASRRGARLSGAHLFPGDEGSSPVSAGGASRRSAHLLVGDVSADQGRGDEPALSDHILHDVGQAWSTSAMANPSSSFADTAWGWGGDEDLERLESYSYGVSATRRRLLASGGGAGALICDTSGGLNETCSGGGNASSAANSSCLFLYNNASEWEPAGCYRGDYNLTCDNTTQTLSNTSGVFHGRQGRCSQGGASAPDGADDVAAAETPAPEVYVCDNPLHIVTPLNPMTSVFLGLAAFVGIGFGLLVDFCKR